MPPGKCPKMPRLLCRPAPVNRNGRSRDVMGHRVGKPKRERADLLGPRGPSARLLFCEQIGNPGVTVAAEALGTGPYLRLDEWRFGEAWTNAIDRNATAVSGAS